MLIAYHALLGTDVTALTLKQLKILPETLIYLKVRSDNNHCV